MRPQQRAAAEWQWRRLTDSPEAFASMRPQQRAAAESADDRGVFPEILRGFNEAAAESCCGIHARRPLNERRRIGFNEAAAESCCGMCRDATHVGVLKAVASMRPQQRAAAEWLIPGRATARASWLQ